MRATVRTAMGTAMRATVGAAVRAMPGRGSLQFIAIGIIVGDAFFRASSHFVSVFVIEFGMIVHYVLLLQFAFTCNRWLSDKSSLAI